MARKKEAPDPSQMNFDDFGKAGETKSQDGENGRGPVPDAPPMPLPGTPGIMAVAGVTMRTHIKTVDDVPIVIDRAQITELWEEWRYYYELPLFGEGEGGNEDGYAGAELTRSW